MKKIREKILLVLSVIVLMCVIQISGKSSNLVKVKADDSKIEMGLESTYTLNEDISMLTMSGLYQFRSLDSSIVSCGVTSHDLDTSGFMWKHSVTLTGNSVGTTEIELYDPSTNNVIKKYTVTVYSYFDKLCVNQTKSISVSTTIAGGYDVSCDKSQYADIRYTGYSSITTNYYSRISYNYDLSFSEPGVYTITFTHRQTNYPKEITILVEDHNYSSSWINWEPDCINEGQRIYSCSRCGNYKYESIPATGHDWDTDYTVDKEATCSEKGQNSIHCKKCNAIKPDSKQEIALKEHQWEDEYTVDKKASCTKRGIESIHCKVCGEIKEGSEKEIPILGHQWNEGQVTKKANCIEAGEKEYTCKTCGEKRTEELAAKGHDWASEYTVDKKATCTEDGVESIHCKVCGKIKEGSEKEIPVTGHKWNEGKVIKEASCTHVGEKEYTCETCGEKRTEELAAKGHDWASEYTVDKKATCTEDGVQSIHCKVCGEIKQGTEKSIPASGHTPSDVKNKKESTYTSEGYTGDIYCKVCGEKISAGQKIKKLTAEIPQKIVIKKLTAGKKKIKVKFKSSNNAVKYQIQYSLKKNMKLPKVKTVTKTTNTIKKLKSKKKYYVRVRAINAQGRTGSWSKISKIKVK